jgi:hypothetical protein
MKPSTYFKVTYLFNGNAVVSAVQWRDLPAFRASYEILKVEQA